MSPVRWSQFVGHLLAINDEAHGAGGDRAARVMMMTPVQRRRRPEATS